MNPELTSLLAQANKIYQQNFPNTTCFERAVFFSWGCTIGDCTFCYMSTQPASKKPTETKRSNASILAEFILSKHLGWDIGFFTGGIGILKPDELEFLLKTIYQITQQKIWLSVGPTPKPLLERYHPYIRGVVGSTETINPQLHKRVCPSKPLAPYEKMFEHAKELNLERAMTFIVGLGETREDLPLLINFINKYEINKIHIYSLIPEKGTPFEHSPIPSAEEHAWWIAQLRINIPTINIQCGIWEDRVDRISLLLNAGANSISKFKALKLFGTPIAKEIEHQATITNRTFQGTITTIPQIDWDAQVDILDISSELKQRIKFCLHQYLRNMQKNIDKNK